MGYARLRPQGFLVNLSRIHSIATLGREIGSGTLVSTTAQPRVSGKISKLRRSGQKPPELLVGPILINVKGSKCGYCVRAFWVEPYQPMDKTSADGTARPNIVASETNVSQHTHCWRNVNLTFNWYNKNRKSSGEDWEFLKTEAQKNLVAFWWCVTA